MASAEKNRQITFVRRPDGPPTPDVFAINEGEIPTISDGEILCRNLVLSVDPYLRLKMYDRRSYTPPLQIGEQIPGRSIAQVVESRAEGFKAGDTVAIGGGWQDYVAIKAKHAVKVDLGIATPGMWLGPLGMTGHTAYAGLLDIGKPKAGETIVVSGAAGAVGSLVGQIGKIYGCKVVGIAGSDEKCDVVVKEFGFDACVNYRADDFEAQLENAIGNGFDIYFDNVGGAVTRSVTKYFNDFGRLVACGLISQYSGQQPSEPTAYDEFFRLILSRRLTVGGFIVSDISHLYPEFHTDMAKWLAEGKIAYREFPYQGFENIVPAFMGMLAGENTGKTLVTIAEAQ